MVPAEIHPRTVRQELSAKQSKPRLNALKIIQCNGKTRLALNDRPLNKVLDYKLDYLDKGVSELTVKLLVDEITSDP